LEDENSKFKTFHGLAVPRWNKWVKAKKILAKFLAQVAQAVFSRPENSTLEQVAQAVKFKPLVQNLNRLKITDF